MHLSKVERLWHHVTYKFSISLNVSRPVQLSHLLPHPWYVQCILGRKLDIKRMIRDVLRQCLLVQWPLFQLHYICDFQLSAILTMTIKFLCSSSQCCIDVMATRSYDSSRTTMCRMRFLTPRHSSPPHDTHLTSGSSASSASPAHFSAQTLFAAKSLERLKDEEIDFNLLTAVPFYRRQYCQLMKRNLKVNP